MHRLDRPLRNVGSLSKDVACSDVVARWLIDDDCWVLEHVHRLFHYVFSPNQGLKPVIPTELQQWFQERLLKLPTDTVLGRIPEWHLMRRDQFLEELEVAKRDYRKTHPTT